MFESQSLFKSLCVKPPHHSSSGSPRTGNAAAGLSWLAPYQAFLARTWQRRHFLVAVFSYRTEGWGITESWAGGGALGSAHRLRSRKTA